jgi:hypothetical protein
MDDFVLTVEFVEYVPLMPEAEPLPVFVPDEFVLSDAPADSVAVDAPVETVPMVAEEPVAAFVPTIYFQDVYNGFGFYAIDDGDPLVDDFMTGEWAFRRADGTFGPASEWDGLLA